MQSAIVFLRTGEQDKAASVDGARHNIERPHLESHCCLQVSARRSWRPLWSWCAFLFAVVHAQGCVSRNCAGHLVAKHESQSSLRSELPPFSPATQVLRVSCSQDSKAPQLLDAWQSALQSRSVANVHLSLFLVPSAAVCFSRLRDQRPAAAGKWLWFTASCMQPPSSLLSSARLLTCWTRPLSHSPSTAAVPVLECFSQ